MKAIVSSASTPRSAGGGAPSVSCVIPVCDEAESLEALQRSLQAHLEKAVGASWEVIYIDDGSKDASWRVIESLHAADPRVRGLRFRRNFGKSAALASGFAAARGERILTLDADGQDDPAEIPRFLEKLEEGYDLVSGWKVHRQDPVSKTLPSKIFNWVTRRVSGIQIHDFNCGFKAYRRPVVKTVHLYGELHRFIPLLAQAEGFRIGEIEVEHHARQHGVSKFGSRRLLKGAIDLLTVTLLTRYLRRPGHLFGGLGFVSGCGGFAILLYLSLQKVLFGINIGARPLFFLGILLFLLGVQLLSIGLLGELIISSRKEKDNRVVDTLDREPG